jgi:hypothetical protein
MLISEALPSRVDVDAVTSAGATDERANADGGTRSGIRRGLQSSIA